MAHSHYLYSLETFHPTPASDEQYLLLSQELALQGEYDHALEVADAAYDRGAQHGNRFMAGQAASIASFAAAKGGYDHDIALDFGEKSQQALPANQPVGDRLPIVKAATTNRCRAAARIMLRNNIPSPNETYVIRRALSLIQEDMSENAAFKRAIVRSITGASGAHIALQETKQGFADALARTPDTSLLAAARHAGKTGLTGAVALSFVAPQAVLGRLGMPLRRLQKPIASELLGAASLPLEPADLAVVAQLPAQNQQS